MNDIQIQLVKAAIQLMIINIETAVEVSVSIADAAAQQQREALEIQEHIWERL